MTKGFLKLSKRKQKLYEKLLKTRTSRNESICEAYKSLFESLNQLKAAKPTKGSFPRRMIIDGQQIFDQEKIANCFNKFFVDIGPKLASMIPESQTKFDQYQNPHQTLMGEANFECGK